MTEPELKPCPFCGGRAKVMNGPDDWVQCDRCGATTAFSATVESAIAKWNGRTLISMSDQAELARLENIALGTLIRKLEDIVRENEGIIKVAEERDHDEEGDE